MIERGDTMKNNIGFDYLNPYEWMDKIGKFDPLIITIAINGGVQGKEANPAIPETPDEIAASSYDAYNAGASIVHIHGRDPKCLYKNSGETEVYQEINCKVRYKCKDIIINNTTGGGPTTTAEDRMRILDACPEMASLNLGPDMTRFRLKTRPEPLKHPHEGLLFDECMPATYSSIEKLAATMKEKEIKPEMEIYHPGQYWVSQELIKQGLLKPPYLFQYIMGYQTSSYPTPKNLINLVEQLPENSVFSAVGIGKYQWMMTTLSIILGGNVRVGLEDNVYMDKGVKLRNNMEAVEKIVRIARELGREIATPVQAREMLNISQIPRKY